MIYIACLLTFFFTACSPTPHKFKMFEYEITQPQKQPEEVSNAAQEGKE